MHKVWTSFCGVALALLWAVTPARADFTAMAHKGCVAMSFVDANTGYLIKASNLGGYKIHKLSGGTWDAGAKTTITLSAGSIKDMHFVDAKTGFIGGQADSIFKSVDGGVTWTATKITASGGEKAFIVSTLDFGSKTHGIATGRFGKTVATAPLIAVTTDAGATWKTVTAPTDCESVTAAGMAGEKTLVIGGLHGPGAAAIWMSVDGGATWTKRKIIAKGVSDIQFIDDHTGFVASYPGAGVAVSNNEQLIVTTDGAKTWTSPSGNVIPKVQIFSQGWVDKNNGYVAGAGIARTKDGGKTWTAEALPSTYTGYGAIVHTVAYPGPAAYVCPSAGNIAVGKNGTAGGVRPDRYAGGSPKPDAGPVADGGQADSGPSADLGPKTDGTKPAPDGSAPKTDSGSKSDGDDGGSCRVAVNPSQDLGLLALLVLLGAAWIRRRRS